jgi:hypothetical protein
MKISLLGCDTVQFGVCGWWVKTSLADITLTQTANITASNSTYTDTSIPCQEQKHEAPNTNYTDSHKWQVHIVFIF